MEICEHLQIVIEMSSIQRYSCQTNEKHFMSFRERALYAGRPKIPMYPKLRASMLQLYCFVNTRRALNKHQFAFSVDRHNWVRWLKVGNQNRAYLLLG